MLFRLLELAGLLKEDNISIPAAVAVLKGLGANDENLSSTTDLGQLKRSLLRRLHPDVPGTGNEEAFKAATRAIDMLMQIGGVVPNAPVTNAQNLPNWAKAGGETADTTIKREDFTDVNFIRKTMYDMSYGEDDQEAFHIMAYDGHAFRRDFYCYATMGMITELAHAMYVLNKSAGTRAIFMQHRRSPDLWLIFNKDAVIDPVKVDSSTDPMHDKALAQRLPSVLQRL